MSVDSIVKAIEGVLPRRRPIGHHDPYIGYPEHEYLDKWRRTIGPGGSPTFWQDRLADELKKTCGVPYVVPTNSGTSALHLALLALKVQPNEEVLVPSLTFVGSVNPIRYVGAVPNFIDCSLVMSGQHVREYLEKHTKEIPHKKGRLNSATNRVISAIVVVDLLGFPADLKELEIVAEEFGLHLIEDAAQALGSKLENRACGSYGNAAILSFNNNKIVTGYCGGALLTGNKVLADKARHLSNTARIKHPWEVEHTDTGYNYRMSSVTAALVCAQLERLDEFMGAKQFLRSMYEDALSACPTLMLAPSANGNNWLISIIVDPSIRELLFHKLYEKGIHARALFMPLHRQFSYCPHQNGMKMTEYWFERVVCLPSGVGLV